MKKLFTSQLILAIFKLEKPITLETDALDGAIRAYLSQLDEKGRLYLVTFHSRKLNSAKLNYKIHDKELLAIIDAFK